jgi:hypothetical protein
MGPRKLGRFAFVADEGYRVVFRRADGALAWALFWVGTALTLGITWAVLQQEPAFSWRPWGIAGLVDFAIIYTLFAMRRGLSRGGLIVDGSERRVFLPEGAELRFEHLRAVEVEPRGGRAELTLVLDEGTIPFGPRPAAEVAQAAEALARVGEIPLRPAAS